jgi:hypothetical protein
MYWDQFQNVPVCGSENEASDQEKRKKKKKKGYLIYALSCLLRNGTEVTQIFH